jgi:hypothetical protein
MKSNHRHQAREHEAYCSRCGLSYRLREFFEPFAVSCGSMTVRERHPRAVTAYLGVGCAPDTIRICLRRITKLALRSQLRNWSHRSLNQSQESGVACSCNLREQPHFERAFPQALGSCRFCHYPRTTRAFCPARPPRAARQEPKAGLKTSACPSLWASSRPLAPAAPSAGLLPND